MTGANNKGKVDRVDLTIISHNLSRFPSPSLSLTVVIPPFCTNCVSVVYMYTYTPRGRYGAISGCPSTTGKSIGRLSILKEPVGRVVGRIRHATQHINFKRETLRSIHVTGDRDVPRRVRTVNKIAQIKSSNRCCRSGLGIPWQCCRGARGILLIAIKFVWRLLLLFLVPLLESVLVLLLCLLEFQLRQDRSLLLLSLLLVILSLSLELALSLCSRCGRGRMVSCCCRGG